MKIIVSIFIIIFFPLLLFAQTKEEFVGWLVQGIAAAEQENYQEAIQNFKLFIDGYEKSNFPENETYATILHDLASFYFRIEDYSNALITSKKAVKVRRKLYGEQHPAYATSLSNLANYHFSIGEYSQAVELGKKAAEIFGQVVGKNDPSYATSLSNLADYYESLGDNKKAIELGTKALEIRRVVLGEQHYSFVTSLSKLADYYSNSENYNKAEELGTQILEVQKKILGEQNVNYAVTNINVADYCISNGHYEKAILLGTKAMEIFKSVRGENDLDYAQSLHMLAYYYSCVGDYVKAVEFGEKAVHIRKNILGENDLEYASSLHDVGYYYSCIGDYTKAIDLCAQALIIRRNLLGEKNKEYASSLHDLAYYHSLIGDNEKALTLGLKALDVYQSIPDEYVIDDFVACLNSLALIYSENANYSKAIEHAIQAKEIVREKIGDKNNKYTTILHNLALYYSQLGENDKAIELELQALIILREITGENHPHYAIALSKLAHCYDDIGNHTEAIKIGLRAKELIKHLLGDFNPHYAISLLNLSFYYLGLGKYAECLKYYRENISVLQSNTFQQFVGLTSFQRANYWNQKSFEFTDVYPFFTYLTHATAAPDLYDKSALFAKGLLISTEIEMNRLIQESGDEEALRMFDELQMNRMQLQKLYETPIAERHINTDSLAQVVDRQEQALVKRSKAYGDFTRKLRTTWQDVQGALKDDEIAVEFLSFNVYGTDSTMVAALTLRKDDAEPKFIPLFEQRQLQEVSDQRYFHCPELTSLVWRPLQQELKGIKRIYFSPAGVLHNIGIEYAPGMENYEMYRLSTTREIIREASPSPSQGGEKVAALYGGVDYNASISGTPPLEGTGEVSIALHRSLIDSLNVRGMTATYLPATLEEVQGIKASFDKKKQVASLTTGKEATETAVKTLSANSPKILHIATHGFYWTEERANYARSQEKLRFLGQDDHQSAANLEDKALTRSGLLMAGANGTLHGEDRPLDMDDGVLTAQEISRLALRGLDLVVLSACKTGNGDINQGEGVFGLQRGFKKAGAQTIVMSLWEVDDKATQILMTAFYDNLLQGQSKRDAFQNAQQHLRTVENGRYDEPQYWAAFIQLD